MKVMAIYEFGGPEVMKLIEKEKPVPAGNQVLIRVTGTSVNNADIQTREGVYHAGGANFPLILGLDVTGVVEQIGSEVKAHKTGDTVIAFPHTGSYAEYVVADEKLAFKVPDGVPFEQAAGCGLVTFTAYNLLADVGRMKPGDTVLIYGASGALGTSAIQIAKSLGAGKILGTEINEEKMKTAYDAGADHVICTTTTDFAEETKKYTGGAGADIIIDPLGGIFTEKGLTCLAPYGRYVVAGNGSGSYCSNINTKDLHGSCRAILGFSIGTTRKLRPEMFIDTAKNVFGLMTSGKLKLNISKVFPLEEAAAAHIAMRKESNAGKILLKTNQK